jgi:pyrroloquinoline quinone biosynthesis protein D
VELSTNTRPRLAAGCRLTGEGENRNLLFPEGALRLQGTALAIVELCDGSRTFGQIVQSLEAVYTKAEAGKVRADAVSFLQRLHQKRLVEFE